MVAAVAGSAKVPHAKAATTKRPAELFMTSPPILFVSGVAPAMRRVRTLEG